MLLFGSLTACQAPTSPSDSYAGRWCPIDSTIVYTIEYPLGVTTLRYLPGFQQGTYSLSLDGHGNVTSKGVYRGSFLSEGDTVSGYFAFPLSSTKGHYAIGQAYLMFVWPYPEAGPTWFWEVARHALTSSGWETQLDDADDNWRVHARFLWERC